MNKSIYAMNHSPKMQEPETSDPVIMAWAAMNTLHLLGFRPSDVCKPGDEVKTAQEITEALAGFNPEIFCKFDNARDNFNQACADFRNESDPAKRARHIRQAYYFGLQF